MSAGPPDLDRHVMDFIREAVPAPRPKTMSSETDLRTDLRMIWEDAETLMEQFFERFSVDHGDFALGRYFPAEGSLLTSLLGSITGRGGEKQAPPRLTIGMLCEAAAAGVWRTASVEGRETLS